MQLAILSEVEIEMRFGQKERLSYLWKVIIEFFGEAKELYDLRIAKSL